MVARRFLAVFHPEAVFENTRVETTVLADGDGDTGYVFRTRGKLLLVPGWRGVYDEIAADAKTRTAATRTRRPISSCRDCSKDEQVQTREIECRARRPNRRGATATRRCSARWRPPASWSTTTSCARR